MSMEKRENPLILKTKVTNRSLFSESIIDIVFSEDNPTRNNSLRSVSAGEIFQQAILDSIES